MIQDLHLTVRSKFLSFSFKEGPMIYALMSPREKNGKGEGERDSEGRELSVSEFVSCFIEGTR